MARSLVPMTLALLCLGAALQGHVSAQEDASPPAEFTVSNVKVVISGEGSPKALTATYPKAVLSGEKLSASSSLEVTLTVKAGGAAASPQQLMLQLENTDKPCCASAYATAKKKGDSYTISMTGSLLDKQVSAKSGTYKAVLLVGDASVAKPLSWELGSVQWSLSSKAGDKAAAPVYRTSANAPVQSVQPEIVHMHRPPEKQPPAAISLAFTGLALLPLLGALVYLGSLGANLSGLSAGDPFFSTLFHASIAAVLGLYLLFWLRLNLAQTLPLALLLGVVVVLTGYKALSAIATARLAAAKPATAVAAADKKKD